MERMDPAPAMIIVGMHLRAGETLYRIEEVGADGWASAVVLSGSKTLIGKAVPWPVSNLVANIALGDVQIVPAPPKPKRRRDTLL